MGLIILLGGSFYGGQRLRLESIQRPLHQSKLAQSVDIRGGAYAATDAAVPPGKAFFPAAISDSATSSSTGSLGGSDDSSQIEDFLNSDSPAATFEQVYMLLKEQFVDRIDSDVPLAHGAASSMIAALDEPNSRFMAKDEREAVEAQSSGLFQGLGAAVMVRKHLRSDGILDRELTVVDPLPGSVAEQSGLKTGDVITSINGHWVLSYDVFADQADALKKLENDPYDFNKAVDALEKRETAGFALDKAQTVLDTPLSQPLALIVRRDGAAAPLNFTLPVSPALQVQSVESHRLASGTGYIGINIFTENTASDFRTAISQLDSTKGLIIDLRDCSGGLLEPGIAIAKAFDPTASFGSIELRSGRDSKDLMDGVPTEIKPLVDDSSAAISPITFTGPITVLVNHGTANTAEMLAAFLHDRLGASLIGSSTFGDATAQTLFPLSDGSAFALTTGVMRTDDAVAFNSVGLVPQYALADAGHASDPDSDACILKAVSILSNRVGVRLQPHAVPGKKLAQLAFNAIQSVKHLVQGAKQ